MKALVAMLALVAVTANAQSIFPQLPTTIAEMTCTDGMGEINQRCMESQRELELRNQMTPMTPEQERKLRELAEQYLKESKQ